MSIVDIKNKIKNSQPTVGSWLQLPSPDTAQLMAESGFEWLAVDMEHGPIDLTQLPNIFRAIEVGGCVPFARIAHNDLTHIKHALDAGARGLIIPMVNSAIEAQSAVDAARYPPEGKRGVGFSRVNSFGRNFREYVEKHNDELVLIVQIEHIKAVQSIEKILGTDGVDGYIIGPYDLSGSMNLTGQFDRPEFREAMLKTLKAGLKAGKACGAHIVEPDPEVLSQRIDEGYTFLAYGIDTVFLNNAADKAASEVRTLTHAHNP